MIWAIRLNESTRTNFFLFNHLQLYLWTRCICPCMLSWPSCFMVNNIITEMLLEVSHDFLYFIYRWGTFKFILNYMHNQFCGCLSMISLIHTKWIFMRITILSNLKLTWILYFCSTNTSITTIVYTSNNRIILPILNCFKLKVVL